MGDARESHNGEHYQTKGNRPVTDPANLAECQAFIELTKTIEVLRQRAEKAEAEVERLRGALTTIADMSCQCVCQEATGIAVDALTPPTKE